MCFEIDITEERAVESKLGTLEQDSIGMYDPRDGGVGYLLYLMDNLKPEEITKQDLNWVIEKYQALCDSLSKGIFSTKKSSDTRGIHLLVRYSLFLEEVLSENNIKFTILEGIHQ